MCNQPPICQNHPTVRYIEYHTRCPPDACYFEFLMHSVRQSIVISLVMYRPVKIQKQKQEQERNSRFTRNIAITGKLLSSERVKETLSSAKRRNPSKRIENSF